MADLPPGVVASPRDVLIGIFVEIAGSEDLSTSLRNVLVARNLSSKIALASLTTVTALVHPTLIPLWEDEFGEDRREEGLSFLGLAIEEFRSSYLPGGANHFPAGVAAVVVGQGVLGGVVGGVGNGLGAGTPAPAKGGESVRGTRISTIDKDQNVSYWDKSSVAPGHVKEFQHCLRIWAEGSTRRSDVMDSDCSMTAETYLKFLQDLVFQSKDGRLIDAQWESVTRWDIVSGQRVITNPSKFKLFFGFEVDPQKPHLLSMVDFLPGSMMVDASAKVALRS